MQLTTSSSRVTIHVPPQILGTIQKYTHQSETDRMSAKAQEVAFDRILVDRFKGGDSAAFDEMVTRYWDRIYAMVNQLLRNLFCGVDVDGKTKPLSTLNHCCIYTNNITVSRNHGPT